MDVIEQIKKLAGEAADLTLQKFSAKRIGAQAERLGLFQAYIRSVPSSTFFELLRERQALLVGVTNQELFEEFAKRELLHVLSYEEGLDAATKSADRSKREEQERVAMHVAQIEATARAITNASA